MLLSNWTPLSPNNLRFEIKRGGFFPGRRAVGRCTTRNFWWGVQTKVYNFLVTFCRPGLLVPLFIPVKSIPIFRLLDQYGKNSYPISDQNGSKTILFGTMHTCTA